MTLIELAVVMAITAILVSVAVPSYTDILDRTQVIAHINELHASMLLARSEAIKRNGRVSVCPSADGQSCAANSWQAGWMVFVDRNGNAKREPSETILRVHSLPPEIQVSGNAPVQHYVSYMPSGASQLVNGALQMGTFTLCRGTQGRALIISASGRPRIQTLENC